METVFLSPLFLLPSSLSLPLSIYLHTHTHTLFASLSLSPSPSSICSIPPSFSSFSTLPPPSSNPHFSLLSLSLSRSWGCTRGFHTVSAATLVSTEAPPPGVHLVPGQPSTIHPFFAWKPTSPSSSLSFVSLLRRIAHSTTTTTTTSTIVTTTTTTTMCHSIHSGRKSVIVESRGCFNSWRAEGGGEGRWKCFSISREEHNACV